MNIRDDNSKMQKTISINSITKVEFDDELEKGYQDIINGKTISAKEAFNTIRKDFGLL